MASIDGAGVWCCVQASSPCCLPLAAGRGLTWVLVLVRSSSLAPSGTLHGSALSYTCSLQLRILLEVDKNY